MTTPEATTTAALIDGRYRLLDAVGQGGMATVYRAEDVLLGRTVAVKMIRHVDDATTSADRAHVEEAALASLNHPALVTLFDSQLEPGRAQYLVMEYVDGPTLSSCLARGPLSERDVARLACDLAEALDAVHTAGIIHRDVKPSNVLMRAPRREGAPWTAKLADFGIACAIGASRITSPGVVLGTVAYMAPEQLRGAELTPAVDVYALGLILIEALSGRPGYASGNSVESALARLSVPPLMTESIAGEWRELLTRMTSIDPADRPSAAEVATIASALLERASGPPSPVQAVTHRAQETGLAPATAPTLRPLRSRVRRGRDVWRRRRAIVAVSAAAAAAAVVAGATLAVHPQPTAREAGGSPVRTGVVSQTDGAVDPQPVTVADQGTEAPVGELTTGPGANAGSGTPPHAHGPGGKPGQGGGGQAGGQGDDSRGGDQGGDG